MRLMITATLLSLLSATGVSLHAEEDARPRYSLKQDQPDIGTNIRRDIVSGSILPLDKRYAELTREQRATIKSQYEQMEADDEPPFPIDGLGPLYKVMAVAQQRLLVTGSLTLLVEVNSQGEANSVSVLQPGDPEMVKFVASVLMLQKYKPAVCQGNPCTMQFPFRISFATRF